MKSSDNRREFLEKLGIGAAGLVTAGYTATARGFAANETVNVGCIGCGGRLQMLMNTLREVPGTRITAVSDVWDVNLAAGNKIAGDKAATSKDFRRLLERSDVDAVMIGSPDHWHVPMAIEACAAGKDVYVEKPLTHDMSEGPKIVEAQNKHKRIVQVGTQQRSMPHLQKAHDIVKSGELGKIHKVHLTWNRNIPRWKRDNYGVDPKSVDWKRFVGNAKQQPFDQYRFRQWRWFWDFGGGILTDLMVHFLDVVHWYLDLEHPQMAATIGDQFATKGVWETPDTVQTLLHYPDRDVQVYFEGTFINARNAAMAEFMGSEATLYVDRGRYEIHPERKSKLKYSELVLGTGPRGKDFYDKPNGELLHIANWIECVRSRNKPNAPAEAGASGAAAAHLANRALRTGQVARWNG